MHAEALSRGDVRQCYLHRDTWRLVLNTISTQDVPCLSVICVHEDNAQLDIVQLVHGNSNQTPRNLPLPSYLHFAVSVALAAFGSRVVSCAFPALDCL